MSLAKEDGRELVDAYIPAWTTPDPQRMREVAILELKGDRIASLREYWSSERPNT